MIKKTSEIEDLGKRAVAYKEALKASHRSYWAMRDLAESMTSEEIKAASKEALEELTIELSGGESYPSMDAHWIPDRPEVYFQGIGQTTTMFFPVDPYKTGVVTREDDGRLQGVRLYPNGRSVLGTAGIGELSKFDPWAWANMVKAAK